MQTKGELSPNWFTYLMIGVTTNVIVFMKHATKFIDH